MAPDHPVASATAISQLFSSCLALVAVAVVAGDFTCLPLPAPLYPGCFFPCLFPLFSPPSCPSPSVGKPVAVSISPPMSHLSISPPVASLHSRDGHRSSRDEIDDYDVETMSRTTKTATCSAVAHISHYSSRTPRILTKLTVPYDIHDEKPRLPLLLPCSSFFSADVLPVALSSPRFCPPFPDISTASDDYGRPPRYSRGHACPFIRRGDTRAMAAARANRPRRLSHFRVS